LPSYAVRAKSRATDAKLAADSLEAAQTNGRPTQDGGRRSKFAAAKEKKNKKRVPEPTCRNVGQRMRFDREEDAA
jgi:hypothetical protein